MIPLNSSLAPGGTELISLEEALVPSSGDYYLSGGELLSGLPSGALQKSLSESTVKLSKDYLLSF